MKTKNENIERPTLATIKRGHRVTYENHVKYCRALGIKPRMGRPPKGADRHIPVSLRLPPAVIEWAKKQGKFQNIGYQTFIKNFLLQRVKHSYP